MNKIIFNKTFFKMKIHFNIDDLLKFKKEKFIKKELKKRN